LAAVEMSTINRRRIAALNSASRRTVQDNPSPGGAILCKTTRMILPSTAPGSIYPSAAKALYGLQQQSISVEPNEGATPTFADVGNKFLGLNVGSKVPPEGTTVMVLLGSTGIWFVYD
jgi:hypothetical protein